MRLARSHSDSVSPEAWCHLIRQRYGLTFRETQIPAVLAYVREQSPASGLPNEQRYYERLSAEPAGGPEWTALVEHLLNHESSFFRHLPSFNAVRTSILPELRDAHGRGSRLNFWSAGCATGQEAYSLAMLAMDDDELRGEFTVWGGDISRQAIEFARRGRYGPRAIAGVPDEYRKRFLNSVGTPAAAEYEVNDALRWHVRFSQVNLVANIGMTPIFDVIFCQNVLIYFSPLAVSQAVALLASRLSPGGYLLLGPGEEPAARPPALDAVTVGGVRMFRRKSQTPAEVRP